MKMISWSEYLGRVIAHNLFYACAVLQQWAYQKFDKWRESVFIRQGRGASKDYHLMMVGHTAKQTAEAMLSPPHMAFFAANSIIPLLKLPPNKEKFAYSAFHPSFRLAFIYERDIMTMVHIQDTIVDGKTFLQAFELFDIAGRRQLEFVLGHELYAQLEASPLELVQKHFLDLKIAETQGLNRVMSN